MRATDVRISQAAPASSSNALVSRLTHGAFVATGCLRKYVVDPKGNEHIVQFAPENSNLLLFDAASHQRAVDRVPGYAAGFRRVCSGTPRRRTSRSSTR
jgi:hypothetical protein